MSLNYSENLTAKLSESPAGLLLDRSQSLKKLGRSLTQECQKHPIIIGKPGVGRTTFLTQAAHYCLRNENTTQVRQIRRLDIAKLADQMGSQFTECLRQTIYSIKRLTTPVILFIDELEFFYQDYPQHWQSVFSFLKEISRKQLVFFGLVCSPAFYYHHLQIDTRFNDSCETVWLTSPARQETALLIQQSLQANIINKNLILVENLHHQVVSYAEKFINSSVLPGAAFHLLNELLATETSEINESTIQTVLSIHFQTPVSSGKVSCSQRLERLIGLLSTKIIGQQQALTQLQDCLPLYLLQLNPKLVVPLLIFYGAPSVGKETTAEQLASFSQERLSLIKLDFTDLTRMTVLQALRSLVKTQKPGVVLFKNIEQASSELLLLLLDIAVSGIVNGEALPSQSFFIFTHDVVVEEESEAFIEPEQTAVTEEEELLQLVVDDMPALEMTVEPSQLSEINLEDHFCYLPRKFFDKAEFIAFASLSGKAQKALIEQYLTRLRQQVKAKQNLDLTFAVDLKERLFEQYNFKELSAREIHAKLDELLLPVISQHLLYSDQSTNSLSIKLNEIGKVMLDGV